MMGRRRSVAIVMPMRNEENEIDATLESILNSTRLPDECIIADGMSTDRSVERIRAFENRGMKIRVVENPTLWCGGGRNRAVEQTACEVIVLADFGNLMEPAWLENMVRPFEEQPDIDIVAGMFRPRVRSDYEHCMSAIHYYEDRILDRLSDEERAKLIPAVILPGGLATAFSRDIWQRVGGYPEWLAKAQDKMFSRKVHALGGKAAIAWDARIHHHMRNGPLAVFKQTFLYGRGNGQSRFISRHFFKLIGFYGLIGALCWAGALSWIFPALGGLLMLAYFYHSGLRKVINVDGGLNKIKYLWLVPMVLIPRDLGVVLGHWLGWFEWFFVPRYRRLYRDYVRDCPPERFTVIAP